MFNLSGRIGGKTMCDFFVTINELSVISVKNKARICPGLTAEHISSRNLVA